MRKGFIVFSHTLTKEQEKELNNKDFVNISEKLIENEIIPKIKLFHINISNLEEEKVLNDSTLSFSKKDSKKYIFKIKTSIRDNFPPNFKNWGKP